MIDFGSHEKSSERLKILIPSSTSFQNQVFSLLAPRIPPDTAFSVSGKGLTGRQWIFGDAFGCLFDALIGGHGHNI